jgi:hypothetical protein
MLRQFSRSIQHFLLLCQQGQGLLLSCNGTIISNNKNNCRLHNLTCREQQVYIFEFKSNFGLIRA